MGRQSMPVRHNSRNWLRRSLYGLLIVFLAVLIAAVCIFSILNANGLKNTVGRRTEAYVNDVAFQITQNIDAQLSHVMQDLEMLSDSLVRMGSNEDRMEFLKRKTPMLGFTQPVLCGLDGKGICTDGTSHDFSGLPGFELVGLPDAAVREGFSNPSIIVVGDVVRIKDKLDWFDIQPGE